MLTLGQIEMLIELKSAIANSANEVNAIESQYLISGTKSIQDGNDFVATVRDMNLKFMSLENRGIKLSEYTKRLSEDLTKKYGNPNLVYSGYGQYAGWRRIDDPIAGKEPLKSLLMPFSQVIITFIVAGLLFLNPLILRIKAQFGEFGYIIFNVVVVALYLIWLLITGSLKKPRR